MVAALALYHIRYREGAYVPVGASSRDQAEQLYRQAEGFVRRSPKIRRDYKCLEGYRRIRCDVMQSRIQIFAADDRTGDGVIPTLCIAEELHRHRDMGLYRTWTGKLRKRGGQIVAISTAGEPGSEFEQARVRIRESAPTIEREACFVRAAAPSIVLHDWAVPEKADVEDLEVVKNANPFSRITVETLREKRDSPTMTLAHWRRYVCDQPIRDEETAISEAEWAQLTTADRIPHGASIALGLDVAWKWDSTAAVPLWVDDAGRRVIGKPAVLTPPRDGSSLRPDVVKRAIMDIHRRNPIHTVVMDMTRAEELAQWAQDELGATVIDHSQSNAQAALDYERFMAALRGGHLVHTGDPTLARHALNATARALYDGRTRFERPSASRAPAGAEQRVIDALVAAAMANSHLEAERVAPPKQRWRVLAS